MDTSQLTPILALLVPLMALSIPIVTVVAIYLFKIKKEKLTHETICKLVEQGVSIPPELLRRGKEFHATAVESEDVTQLRLNQLFRKSVVALFFGFGVVITLLLLSFEEGHFSGDTSWAIGLIPIMLGGAWLVIWRQESGQFKSQRAIRQPSQHEIQ